MDLFCGLGGWADGFLAEGIDVIGFDIERHDYGTGGYPGQLVIQDVRTLVGSQFKDALCIVASPPCQEFSYRAMPWKIAKAQTPEILPPWWEKTESEMDAFELREWMDWREAHPLPPPSTELFDACFRIQREACEAAGRHIPMIVENVKGAQPWVGRAQAHFGSYYLWGNVGQVGNRVVVLNGPLRDVGVRPRSRAQKVQDHLNILNGESHTRHLTNPAEHTKNNGGSWFSVAHNTDSGVGRNPVNEGRKITGPERNRELNEGEFGRHKTIMPDGMSGSVKRKAASAEIARIPLTLARHVAKRFVDP